MKADPTRQQRLLELQAIDTRLDQIEHARRTLPQLAELEQLTGQARELHSDVVRAQTALSDAQREVERAEADVQLVRDRSTRNQQRLEAGTGTAKDLQALQHELTSLARRQAELEEVELEVMERVEQHQAEATELESRQSSLRERIGSLEQRRDDALADLDADHAKAAAPRAEVAGQVGDDLIALYDKIRQQQGGLGAAPLVQRRCGGCQLQLNPVDLQRISSAAEDEVLRCEECRRIIVRTPESGL